MIHEGLLGKHLQHKVSYHVGANPVFDFFLVVDVDIASQS